MDKEKLIDSLQEKIGTSLCENDDHWDSIADVVIKEIKNGYKNGYKKGYFNCLDDYSIWKDGTQTIGCMNKDIKAIKYQFELEDK